MTDKIIKLIKNEPEDVPADDIVRMMRETADKIEEGAYGHSVAASLVLRNDEGSLDIFGWGPEIQKATDNISQFAVAQHVLIGGMYGD